MMLLPCQPPHNSVPRLDGRLLLRLDGRLLLRLDSRLLLPLDGRLLLPLDGRLLLPLDGRRQLPYCRRLTAAVGGHMVAARRPPCCGRPTAAQQPPLGSHTFVVAQLPLRSDRPATATFNPSTATRASCGPVLVVQDAH